MDRYGATVVGLWIFGIGYGVHWLLYPLWRTRKLHRALHVPLGIVAWGVCIGLVLPWVDFVKVVSGFIDHPNAGAAFEVGAFVSLAMLLAWLYQNGDALRYEELKPFLRTSLLFRHTQRVRDNIFAIEEQKRIDGLAVSATDKKLLRDLMVKKRVPMDRARELLELDRFRAQRKAAVGKEELALLTSGRPADITDMFRLHHLDEDPQSLFGKTFRVNVDSEKGTCQACVVVDHSIRDRLNEPARWFRFRQDLFDLSEGMYHEEWMERFRPFFTVFEVECHQEETDSFGLPRRTAFLQVGIPVSVLREYKDRLFIATELDRVATMTWLEGDRS